jgi:hypothetical protein
MGQLAFLITVGNRSLEVSGGKPHAKPDTTSAVQYYLLYIFRAAGGICHADHVAPSIRTSWQSLRRQAAVARSV